ncbi:MAG: phosphoribosylamine--glycine ligase [Eubacteriales bacterium]|nr:phosphoribosylamine--glycine ligase [Eubacteriales bacterium]
MTDVLVVGGGGREHALVWKISQSSRAGRIYCIPGNGGISNLAECVPLKATDIDGIKAFALERKVDMAVIGPDDPLAAGITDVLEEAGIRTFGPGKKAARIEASKVFSKGLMLKYGIPTAKHEVFDEYGAALKYLKSCDYPAVIKADGLALGKGVIIAENFTEASRAVEDIMVKKVFGEAGRSIVAEEYLEGTEVTVLAFTDGDKVVPMVSSQDHKRAYDSDKGPNTGGMGTFSPSRIYSPAMAEICMKTIFEPSVKAMSSEGNPFKGVLYFGLMITADGPRLLEYNSRFGDPEAQVVLPRLKTDILDIFDAVIDNKLDSVRIEWEESAAVCVVAASGGYPVKYEKGFEITGLDKAESREGILVFHAGTEKHGGRYYTSGGRVLGVTALADNLEAAAQKAYEAISDISFKGMYYRRDIAKTR